MECLKSAVLFMRGLLGVLGSCARYHCLQTYEFSNCRKNLGITGMCFSVKRGSITMMGLAQINSDSGLERCLLAIPHSAVRRLFDRLDSAKAE
jgi:hypothetical protein